MALWSHSSGAPRWRCHHLCRCPPSSPAAQGWLRASLGKRQRFPSARHREGEHGEEEPRHGRSCPSCPPLCPGSRGEGKVCGSAGVRWGCLGAEHGRWGAQGPGPCVCWLSHPGQGHPAVPSVRIVLSVTAPPGPCPPARPALCRAGRTDPSEPRGCSGWGRAQLHSLILREPARLSLRPQLPGHPRPYSMGQGDHGRGSRACEQQLLWL